MSGSNTPANHATPLRRPVDLDAIRPQLERILTSAPFHNSKRYPRFLRFVVDETLAGRAEQLKERVLGIQVFDRLADYDLATDPIVRIVASEIRKRLALYYVDHERELRIHLQPGSYVPEFFWPEPESAETHESASPAAAEIEETHAAQPAAKRTFRLRRFFLASAVCLSILLAATFFLLHKQQDVVSTFWHPVLASEANPIVCLGDIGLFMPENTQNLSFEIQGILRKKGMTGLTDVEAYSKISSYLIEHGKHPSLSSSSTITYQELQQHPAILIGWRNNPWTARAVESLRYQFFKADQGHISGIRDMQDNQQVKWTVDLSDSNATGIHAYGIVARFLDQTTGQPTILVAGLGLSGTETASNFITSREAMNEFLRKAPSGWEKHNVEIVVESQVIKGTAGPAHVTAVHCW